MNKLKWLWGNLQASFWFVPSLIVAGGIAFAVALIEADSTGSREWLARLASRPIASSHRHAEGTLSIITIGPTFASLVAASFDQIRESAKGNVAIMIRMLGALQTIAGLTAHPGRRQVLAEQVQWIAELAERTIESPHDRARFASRLARARAACDLP